MKKIISIIVSLALCTTLSACGTAKTKESTKKDNVENVKTEKTVSMVVPDGIPALASAKLIKEKPKVNENININYNVEKTPDTLVSKILSGEADIAIVPSNLAAQAYNKGLPYKIVATTGTGSLYVVSNSKVDGFQGLKGKEIYTIGKGLTPDIVFRYLLNKNDLNPDKDIKINYLNGATELAPAYIGGKTSLILVPEPMATTVLSKKTDSKIYIDLNEEWKKSQSSENGFPQSTLIIKKDLIDGNKEFVKSFLDKFKESIEFAKSDLKGLSQYAEDIKLNVNKNAIEKSSGRLNITFINAKDAKEDYNKYFKVLNDFQSKTIGGKLPNEDIYFEE